MSATFAWSSHNTAIQHKLNNMSSNRRWRSSTFTLLIIETVEVSEKPLDFQLKAAQINSSCRLATAVGLFSLPVSSLKSIPVCRRAGGRFAAVAAKNPPAKGAKRANPGNKAQISENGCNERSGRQSRVHPSQSDPRTPIFGSSVGFERHGGVAWQRSRPANQLCR